MLAAGIVLLLVGIVGYVLLGEARAGQHAGLLRILCIVVALIGVVLIVVAVLDTADTETDVGLLLAR
jgi:hypothetical protein